jgi:hypothetical protein
MEGSRQQDTILKQRAEGRVLLKVDLFEEQCGVSWGWISFDMGK